MNAGSRVSLRTGRSMPVLGLGTWKSLRAMDQEYADLVLIHRPPEVGVGADLWLGLARARDEGLTRDIGVSNYSIEQLERLVERPDEPPVVNQIEWSPFGWSGEMLDYCPEHEIVIQGYSPLTRTERLTTTGSARSPTRTTPRPPRS